MIRADVLLPDTRYIMRNLKTSLNSAGDTTLSVEEAIRLRVDKGGNRIPTFIGGAIDLSQETLMKIGVY